MAPVAVSPVVNIKIGRDVKSEADYYVQKMIKNIRGAGEYCPLDSPEKTDSATPNWRGFYDVLSSTTLDIDLENAIIKNPDIVNLLPEMRRVMGETEGALETTWAKRVTEAETSAEGKVASIKYAKF